MHPRRSRCSNSLIAALNNGRGLTAGYFPVSHSGNNKVTILVRGVSSFVVNTVRRNETVFSVDKSIGISIGEQRKISVDVN